MLDDITAARIRAKLQDSAVRANLLKASLFLTAFELLKRVIWTAPNALRFPDTAGPVLFPDVIDGSCVATNAYMREVVPLCRKDRLKAACLWLQVVDALRPEGRRIRAWPGPPRVTAFALASPPRED
jgi:hypothetical protein